MLDTRLGGFCQLALCAVRIVVRRRRATGHTRGAQLGFLLLALMHERDGRVSDDKAAQNHDQGSEQLALSSFLIDCVHLEEQAEEQRDEQL
eukprot:CAMPEP_0118931362 /NCGR_PEP_ID=MMETSP1169-20130426/7732_1 /TAXON_ID=36882 /ORGANISM="Pyramimonas obovata, Strain CCMP722" /LENGTH=90 /DNA_ID=CAMNT_0006873857 /DNA_START=386 /DNA_END=658 /DNA_ORIENTATION=-